MFIQKNCSEKFDNFSLSEEPCPIYLDHMCMKAPLPHVLVLQSCPLFVNNGKTVQVSSVVLCHVHVINFV